MSLNLERGLWRLSLVASAVLFVGAALLALAHFSQRREAWKAAISQPPGPPIVLMAGGGFIRFPEGTDPTAMIAAIKAARTLPGETQILDWTPGCVSVAGKIELVDDFSELPAVTKPGARAQPEPKTHLTDDDLFGKQTPPWEIDDTCPYAAVEGTPLLAGYVEALNRIYSRRELLAAERDFALPKYKYVMQSIEAARSSGVLPRPATELSWREAWQAIGLCLALGALPLALFGVLRWILRGFVGA
jgi:hypothetical protein